MPLYDSVSFTAASNGTTDFVVSTASIGFRTPQGVVANNAVVSYRAETKDLSQFEYGRGVWNNTTSTIIRSNVSNNSLGNTSIINFSTAPTVFLTALADDIVTKNDVQTLTANITFSGIVSITSNTAANSTSSGSLAVTGGISSLFGGFYTTAKGNQFGTYNGSAVNTNAPGLSDANIVLYNISATNWAGIGTDAGGNLWLKAGVTGSPLVGMFIDSTTRIANFPYGIYSNTDITTAYVTGVGMKIGGSAPITAKAHIVFVGGGTEYGLAFRPNNDTTNALHFFNAANSAVGSIATTATTTTYNTTSDERLKTRFDEDGIDWGKRIDSLWVGGFQSKGEPTKWRLGVRAQQAYGIVPQGVTRPKKEEDYYVVDYSLALGPLSMWGVKDLRKRVKELEDKLAAIQNKE